MFYLEKVSQFLQYDIYFLFSFLFLIITTIVYLKVKKKESAERYFVLIFLVTLLIFVFWSGFLSYKQYLIWQADSFSKYLLPPYQKINYCLVY